MRYVLLLRLAGFYAEELLRPSPRHDGQALVVHESGFVLDASEAAVSRGISSGMALGQARALLRDGVFVERRREEFVDASAAWLAALAPFSSTIEPVDQHEVALDLSDQPRPQEIAALAIAAATPPPRTSETSRASHSLPRLHAGAGASKWLARLAIDHGGTEPIEDPERFLAPLPIGLLSPVSSAARDRLGELGFATIGDVRTLGRDVLTRHFGAEGTTIFRAVRGGCADAVEPLYPPRTLGGFLAFEGGVEDLESVLAGCERLASEIGGVLVREETQASELRLHVEHETGVRTLNRTFSRPLDGPGSVMTGLSLLLGDGVPEPVLSLRVALPLVTTRRARQSPLAGTQNRVWDPRIVEAVSDVRRAYGEDTVRLAADIPVPRRVRLLQEMASLVGWW